MSRTKKPRSSKSGFEPDNDKKLRVPAGLFCFFSLPRAATDAVCSFVYRLVATRRAEMAVPEEMEMQQMNFDVVIVGSGLAGLTVALNLAEKRRVAILAKRSMTEGASDWAQGGIAAVLDSKDNIENHVSDTLIAGAGLCDEGATRFIVEGGRTAIEWLIAQGVP